MASAKISSTTLRLVSTPPNQAQALWMLPRACQNFRPASSRASCFWSHTRITHRNAAVLYDCQHVGYHLKRVQLFSTSISKRMAEDGNKRQPRPSLDRDLGKVPLTSPKSKEQRLTATTLKETLKKKVSALSHENIYTLPNILTFSRLIATPVIGYLIIHNHHLYAFSLFVYAGFSDLLDGWIARKWNLQTVVGSVVDPMADKALMTTLVGCLAINGALPLPLATLILGRDVSLAVAAIYYRYASLPAPKTFKRYWDFSLPSAEVHPTTISKLNTFLQLGLIGTVMCVGLLHDPASMGSIAGGYLQSIQSALGGPDGVQTLVTSMSGVVATTTIYSGLSYVWLRDAVTIMGTNEELKRKQGFKGRMIIGSCYGTFIAVAGWLAWKDWNRVVEDEER